MRDRDQALAAFYAYAKQELGIKYPKINLRGTGIDSNMRDAFRVSPSLYELSRALPEDSDWEKRIRTAKHIAFSVPFSEENNQITYTIS